MSWHVVVLGAAALVPLAAATVALGRILGDADATDFAGLTRQWSRALGATALVGGIGATLATTLGLGYATLAGSAALPGRRLVLALLVLLATIPVYLYVIFVFAVVPLSRYSGNGLAAGVLYGLYFTPLAALLITGVLRLIPRELVDAARLDAAHWRVFLRLTLPWALPLLGSVALLIALLSATDYTMTNLLIVRTLTEALYMSFQTHPQSAKPWLAGLPLLPLVVAGWLLLLFAARRGVVRTAVDARRPPRLPIHSRTAGWILCVLLVGLPVAAYSFASWKIGEKLLLASPTPEQFAYMLEEWWRTYRHALIATALIVPTALGLAWALVRTRRLALLIAAAAGLLLAFPAPLVGITLVELLNHPDWRARIYDLPSLPVAGYVVRFLPLVILLVTPAIARRPVELEYAARVDGAGLLRTFRTILLPGLARLLPGLTLVVLILCIGELPATFVLTRPGYETAAVRAFTLIHFGVYGDLTVLALLCTGGIVLTAALLGVWWRWFAGSTAEPT